MNICLDEPSATKFISSALFTGFRIIDESTIAVFRQQKTVKMNKMYAIGFSILEHSKRCMYEAYYDVLQPHFRQKMINLGKDEMGIELGFSDTDRY
jgi:hypothetical protein